MADVPRSVPDRRAPDRILVEPTLVRIEEATRQLWGDEESGEISDLIYGRAERIHAVIFTMGPGHWFSASKTWKPRYDQHRYYYVVQGTLAIHDPETGDVAVAGPGEVITWRGARYHFGYNVGGDEVVVLDWFAPQEWAPDETESAVMDTKPEPREIRAGRHELLGAWPAQRPDDLRRVLSEGGPVTIRPVDALHFVHGQKRPMLVSILSSSSDLTAGTFSLGANMKSEPEQHAGDEVIFTLSGRLHVHLCDAGDWFEMNRLDCVYLPGGTRHEYWSYGAERSTAAFCVAPGYLSHV
jgi:mannose-6-phosphate isomerase-like protein (cupin superfamily)